MEHSPGAVSDVRIRQRPRFQPGSGQMKCFRNEKAGPAQWRDRPRGGTGLEEGPEGGGISTAAGVPQTGSAALAVTAGQAGQAAIHLYRRLGMALAAQLGAGGIFLGAVVTLCI